MDSKIDTGDGEDRQLTATTTAKKRQKRFDQNYGAMTMVMGYLPPIEQLKLHGLNKWWYRTGVGRVQMSIELKKFFFFVDYEPQIIAVRETGEYERF